MRRAGVPSDDRLRAYIEELTRIFKATPSKHQAHERSRRVLEDISTGRSFITAILWRYLSIPVPCVPGVASIPPHGSVESKKA